MLKWLIVLVCLVMGSCAKNPVTGKSELHLVSEQQEITIGEQYYPYMQQAEGGQYLADPSIQEYVKEVGMKLAKVSDRPDLPYDFVVLNNSVPNAWALPGGKIAINRGLLLELHSEAELAAVLAHEIVHSAARHGAKSMERALLMQAGLIGLDQALDGHKYEDVMMGTAAMGAGLIALKYSRGAELEADKYGIKYMAAAGYDPEAAVELQKTFLRLSQGHDQNWLSGLLATHPPSEERIKENEKTVAQYPKGGKIGTKIYEQKIAHLVKTEDAYKDLDAGYKAYLNGNEAKAFEFAKSGVKIEPKEGHLHNLEGKCMKLQKDYSDALMHFNKAIDCNDNYFDFYLQRGLLYQQMGRLGEAERDLDKSNRLLPSAEAHTALGFISLNQNRRLEAIEHFRMASEARGEAGNTARRMLLQLQR